MAIADAGPTTIHSQVEEQRAIALPEAEMLKTFREYARGHQRSTLTSGQAEILRGIIGNLFCDNLCKRVLQEIRNRLRLARFSISASSDEGKDPQLEYLKGLWTYNHLGALAAAVHWSMLRDGNHAVGLRWISPHQGAPGRVGLVREPFWNGDAGIFLAYDSDDQPTYAVKEWWDDAQRHRRTIWWPDRIERYAEDRATWERFLLPGETEWPIPFLDRAEMPLGIPIVHFANLQLPADGPGTKPLVHAAPRPAAPYQGNGLSPQTTAWGTSEPDPRYGMSELDGGVIGLQDEINDMHRDISASARFAGYQMVWASGVTPAKDDQGNDLHLHVEPGAFFEEPNPDARFGVLPPGSIQSLRDGLQVKLEAISRMTSVPNHLITGNWPSGEAVLRLELPLVDKTETIGESVGPAWSSVAHKAILIENTFGSGDQLDPDALITAVFVNAARRDPLTMSDVADRLSPHVGKKETLVQLGYGPVDVDRIMQQMEDELATFGPPKAPAPGAAGDANGSTATNSRPGPQPTL